MSSREAILEHVRTALGRKAGDPVPVPPPLRLVVPEMDVPDRIACFGERLEALNGKAWVVASREAARLAVEEILNGRVAIASNATFLMECGLTARTGFRDRAELKAACAEAPVGITSKVQFGSSA